jgi:BA14K-like protein
VEKKWPDNTVRIGVFYMRHPIETVPRDGKVVVLEDDTTGTVDIARWSAEALAWLGENGEPSKITPTHWHTLRLDKYLPQEECGSSGHSASKAAPVAVGVGESQTAPGQAKRAAQVWRRFAVSSMAAAMVAASLIGLYFRAEVAAYVTRYAGQQDILRASTIGRAGRRARDPVAEQETRLPSQDTDLLALQQQAEADRARAQAGAQEAAQVNQQEHGRAEALANEATRRPIGARIALERAANSQINRVRQAAEEQPAAAVSQAGPVDPSPAPAEPSMKEDVPPGGCIPIGLTASGEIVFPILCKEFIEQQRGKAVEQKPAAVEEKPGVSLPAWANSDAFVKPAQTAKQPDVARENSKPTIKLVETAPLPKRVEQEPRERAMSPDDGYGCQRYRTYDPASGTYRGYDGQRHSCP